MVIGSTPSEVVLSAQVLGLALAIGQPTLVVGAAPAEVVLSAQGLSLALSVGQPTLAVGAAPSEVVLSAQGLSIALAVGQPALVVVAPSGAVLSAQGLGLALSIGQPTLVVGDAPEPAPTSITVDIGSALVTATLLVWSQDADLGTTFDADGLGQILTQTVIYYSGGIAGTVNLSIDGSNNRFTRAFEQTGRIIFEATSSGETLEVRIADADMEEPYSWIPSNSAEVLAFTTHVLSLSDRSATLTLTNLPPDVVLSAQGFRGRLIALAIGQPTLEVHRAGSV